MYDMKSTIRRLGNSQGVSIPKQMLEEAGLSVNAPVEISVDGSAILIRKIATHPRDGWADDAALVTDEEEDRDWLEADLDPQARTELTWS
jgi:antitoxin MazE